MVSLLRQYPNQTPELPEGSGVSEKTVLPDVKGHNHISLRVRANPNRPKYHNDVKALWSVVHTKSPMWIKLDDWVYNIRYEDCERGDKLMAETVTEVCNSPVHFISFLGHVRGLRLFPGVLNELFLVGSHYLFYQY